MLSWLQLLRLPTVFTAIADVLCGFLIAHALTPADTTMWMILPALVLTSAGLYLGGMVLNDVFDARLDQLERPERPIPSGRISRAAAATAGAALLLTGLSAALVTWLIAGRTGHTLAVAGGIVIAVIAYDSVLKKTWTGPFGMATCRFLNLALGASAAVDSSGSVLSWQQPVVGAAAGLAVYIVGVTWFARNEAGNASQFGLAGGLTVAIVGIVISAVSALSSQAAGPAATVALGQYVIMTGITIARGVSAIRSGQPAILQRTVGKMLLWIIVLDAITVFAVTGSLVQEALLLTLTVPAILLRKRIPMS